ncbi:inositol hexakisphosphate and diphosphoinositol-pentakisphosphate kinase [Coemansia erecta]|uniref:Inositol hexakisphosphate and diphosphoinositol-pentakisphosphate kinase n=1 Tax=Coemansia erecta TaxID=147472 RepID=A0A9W8CSS0_9FUNG|nr:inositol hexakisphosphate and diphosphoinositol-pentakisphosphate kinase [Coemansia erecta]
MFFASIRAASIIRSPALAQQLSRRTLVSSSHRAQDAAMAASVSSVADKSIYLQSLLKEDDAEAAWNQPQVEMVSREVQFLTSDHETCDRLPQLSVADTEAVASASALKSTSPHFIELPPLAEGRKAVIGVCAMDSKARSQAMAAVLNVLVATNRYSVVFFGEKTILDEAIEQWPTCDFLISFFSHGFPLEKALQYTRLRKPFSVNSLVRQFLLLDRRLVLEMLQHAGVPTPEHIIVSRDGGPKVPALVRRVVEQHLGLSLGGESSMPDVEEIDCDTLRIGTRTLRKPFVEKPCDAEDHNIHIYYASWQGGGVRKLFRKVGNKSSEFYAGPASIRTDASYIYEEFIAVENAVDVKVYTVGGEYAHAETRRSPVVDGHVRRNSDGKEMRFITQLTDREREYARRVSAAFGQRVCGFDILRASAGRSLVMDVNGWSFVKGNEQYAEDAARILDTRFQEALRHRWVARFVDAESVGRLTYESTWALKGVLSVCRHADRTPKQKMKRTIHAPSVVALLGPDGSERTLRTRDDLGQALAAMQAAAADPSDGPAIAQLVDVLQRKIAFPGTKVQVRAQKTSGVQVVLKWGGTCTHAGTVQSQDLGERMRKDLMLLNAALLNDVQFFSSAERRVQSTVAAYAGAFVGKGAELPPISIRSDMLDDFSAAKPAIDTDKEKMCNFFNFDGPLEENPFYDAAYMALPADMGTNPRVFLADLCALVRRLIARMERNFATLSPDAIERLQPEWCCNETAELFRERWKKILADFQETDKHTGATVYDPTMIGKLCDSLKYDALHNRRFLEHIFQNPDQMSDSPSDFLEIAAPPAQSQGHAESAADGSSSMYPPDPLFAQKEVRQLYYKARLLQNYVSHHEFGITPEQRKAIGVQASVPLLRKLISDLNEIRSTSSDPRTRFYFTKESHIHTLLNIILLCGMPNAMTYEQVDELDYLTHIIFEVYERKPDVDANVDREYSLRIGFSPGASCLHVLDIDIDSTHALKVLPRRNFTHHMPLDSAIDVLQHLLDEHESQ